MHKILSGTTTKNDGHKHSYRIDDDGNGKTDNVNKHFHKIIKKKVIMAGKHIHTIKE